MWHILYFQTIKFLQIKIRMQHQHIHQHKSRRRKLLKLTLNTAKTCSKLTVETL